MAMMGEGRLKRCLPAQCKQSLAKDVRDEILKVYGCNVCIRGRKQSKKNQTPRPVTIRGPLQNLHIALKLVIEATGGSPDQSAPGCVNIQECTKPLGKRAQMVAAAHQGMPSQVHFFVGISYEGVHPS